MPIKPPFDESQLIVGLQQGNVKAFEQLYRCYSRRLYGNILKMIQHETEAEEILQELFQRIWERRTMVDPAKPFASYLYTIARHLVYDYFAQQIRQRDLISRLYAQTEETYQPIEETLAFKETAAIIADGIRRLPPQRQQVYRLCKIEGKSYEYVSRTLGISISTISDHIVKATKALRTYYQWFLLILFCLFLWR